MERKPPTLRELPPPPEGRTGWPWTAGVKPGPPVRPDGTPWPRITVVTPSLNQGMYIEETIRSVLLQQYPGMQYVIFDGGSSDESVSIIRKYEPWISHWVSEPDRGQSHAINKGLAMATGDIVNWINSDDILTPGALRIVGEAFVDCDMVAGGNYFLFRNLEKDRYAKGLTARGLLRRESTSRLQQMAMWFRRDGALLCGGMDEEMHFAFDQDFFVRYLHTFPRVTYVSEMLGWFRQHEAAKTAALRPKFLPERLRTVDKIRQDPRWADLKKDAEYAARRYQWWIRLADIVNSPVKSTRLRALRVLITSGVDPSIRWDYVTRKAVKKLLMGSELRPFTPVI